MERSFSDSHIDIAHNVYRQLCVADKHKLERLITHPPVVRALAEYKTSSLDQELEHVRSDIRAGRPASKTTPTRSHHQ